MKTNSNLKATLPAVFAAIAAAVLPFIPATGFAQGPVFSFAYKTGDAVPGAGDIDNPIRAGAVWTGFASPMVNDTGQVAFIGKWKAPKQGAIPSQNGQGLFVDNTLIAMVGGSVPGIDGTVWKNFKPPVIDNSGHYLFIGGIKGTGVSSATDTVICTNASGSPAVIAREGFEAPGTDGALFKSFTGADIEGEFETSVFVEGKLIQDPGLGASAANDQAVWHTFASMPLSLILREGSGYSSLDPVATVKSFAFLKPTAGSPAHGRAITSFGFPQFLITLSNSRKLVAMGEYLQPVLTPGALIDSANPTGPVWMKYGVPSTNIWYGFQALSGQLKPKVGGVTTADSKGIFTGYGFSSTWQSVARTTEPAPGFPAGAAFSSFKDPVVSGTQNALAFAGAAKGGGVTNLNDAGIWVLTFGGITSINATGELSLYAREGAEPPNAPAGAQFKTFTSLAYPGDATGPVFTANLVKGPGGITSLDDAGLYGPDASGALVEYLRENQPVLGKTLKNFQVLKNVAGSPGTTRWFSDGFAMYHPAGAAAVVQGGIAPVDYPSYLVIHANFTDKTSAILKVELPQVAGGGGFPM